ncbi:MAG: NAD(P)H-dependent glycerol-3-phosphate dehydrogenase [Chloroherpetonaceae bacterium]|nr:NAD(P)H-dependent glycerol-3-phosphate dehydrogenase [Chloroherpetonaceae bacterium]MDW8436546.1 NAD(P)H-dependent glycerol-3-phosphate dehydrogenase [Chloroherpetonaceae bacterium]
MNVAVLGAGSWGTTLAILLAEKGHRVALWSHNPEKAKRLEAERENKEYLPNAPFPPNLCVTADILDAAREKEMLVVATPAQKVRETLAKLAPLDLSKTIIVNVSKGMEITTGYRMSEVTKDVLPSLTPSQIAALYGPSHAEEVIEKHPTAVVAACPDEQTAEKIQEAFFTPMFRVYVNTDLIGVEVAGSVKNIMALAAGAVDGIGYGDNAKAALITRGLAEISRLGLKLGANPMTFAGLAGVGDLVVTCSSRHSRNRYVGEQIGKGRTLDEVLQEVKMVTEGVYTTKAVVELARKLNVEMPITQGIYDVLFNRKPPKEAVMELMTRIPKYENE